MRSTLLYVAAATTAHLAFAEFLDLGAVEAPAITQAPVHAIAAREDFSCGSSVLQELVGPVPSDEDLLRWAISVTHPLECTVTAPAELSDEYVSWASGMTEWAKNVEKKASETHEVCGYDYLTARFTGICEVERTVLFTNSEGATSTLRQDKLGAPTGIRVNGAPRSHGMLGAGMALAVFAAVAVAL
ncbi:hypothetical protein HJFPF1_11969 [Paramyrothecium foliicola]|nr:hypothetical protein HJFPF1_11969 [Paramyrothecium foliicola]